MTKYLSFIFLYNRAGYKRILLLAGAIPLTLLGIFFFRIGNPAESAPYLLPEQAFGGILPVLALIAVNLLGVLTVANSLNGKKAMKATHATPGYTMRRLRVSPIGSYLTIFLYYLGMILIFWGVTIISFYLIGKLGLTLAGAEGAETKLALGFLRTEIGHALLPIADPQVALFNLSAVLVLAGTCARACYFSWHNKVPSAGVVVTAVPMFLVWAFDLADSYILLAVLAMLLYAALSFGDVLSREKRPKGDPFLVNKYAGITDLDSAEFDDHVLLETNSAAETYGALSALQRYGRDGDKTKAFKKLNPAWLRRRFLPLGISLERANFLFGAGILIGAVEHLLFFGRYILKLNAIESGMKGVTLDASLKMPYFWELQESAYFGYVIGILLVFILQAYWNYEYYNKETKSVYVMKRLPNRKEYARTIWIAPAVEVILILLIMVGQTVLDMGLYLIGTPDAALPSDYLSNLLSF